MHLELLTYEQFLKRGVSPHIARFLTANTHAIKNFDIFVRPINPHWDYAVPRDVTDVVGLWGQNADAYCRWTRAGIQEFVLLYHDDPSHTVAAWTEQGLVAELVRQYHEHLDWHDEEADLRRGQAFADYVGFRYTAKLVEYMMAEGDSADFTAEFDEVFGRLQ